MNNPIQNIKKDPILELISQYIKDYNAYLVGGFVRDSILGIENFDRDIIIETHNIEDLAKDIATAINGHFIPLDCENNIYRIVLEDKKNYIDLTSPIENSLEKDLFRRDLTINAIAYDINKQEFIDPTGGLIDLKNKIIRGISEQNIVDDPLRLLRIFRFKSKFGFEIENTLYQQTKKHSGLITHPARERINVELIKLFEGEFADIAIIEMDECHLLEQILPIIRDVKTVPPNTHHHLTLFNHSIETVKQIQLFISNTNNAVKKHLNSKHLGGVKQLAYLKLAGFLHDIGKPETWTIEDKTGRHRFIKHDDVGSKIVVPILKSLKFSKKQIEYVKKLIKYHIYPSTVVCNEEENEKAQMRFFRKMEDNVIDVIIIAIADRLSALGPKVTEDMVSKNINGLTSLLDKYIQIRENLKPLEKLLDGIEIMEILNINASPLLGKVINELKEAQINGDVSNRDEAIDFVKSTYTHITK